MSNRKTDVYDDLIVDSSTDNNEICNNLNLPYNPSTENPGDCVKDTKFYIKTSENIKSDHSNTICTNDPDNAERKLVSVKSSFSRPWSRYRNPCIYKNGLLTYSSISNNIKKLNVRRKAEILQYYNGNRLTKAEKYSLMAKGINKFNKKQYAYQTMNRVPGNTTTTDPNPYNLQAFGPSGIANQKAVDWLANNTLNPLDTQNSNPIGITLLKCNTKTQFKPTPLSSSDVPRISSNKLNNPETNPFPVLVDVNNPDTTTNKLNSSNNPNNNTLYLNENDNLVNYVPVKRTYKGGSEKWPQSAWEEGDNGFPVSKSGSQNIYYEGYYDNSGNFRYVDINVNGYYNSDLEWIFYSITDTNPILDPNYASTVSIVKNGYKPFNLILSENNNDDEEEKVIKMVVKKWNPKYYLFNDDYSTVVPTNLNIKDYIDYIICYPNKIIPINDDTEKNITISIFSPNAKEITVDTNFDGTIPSNKNGDGVNTPDWPYYVITQWKNMRISSKKEDWGVNDSTKNYRPEIGEYKIIYQYKDIENNIDTYTIISLQTKPFPLNNPLQLNPWDWRMNKGYSIKPPNPTFCYDDMNKQVCNCFLNKTTSETCDVNDCKLEIYGSKVNSPLIVPAGYDTNGYEQPWFDPWIRVKWTRLSYYFEQEFYIKIKNVDNIIDNCSDSDSGKQIWPINDRTTPILFPAPSLPIDAQSTLIQEEDEEEDNVIDNNGDNYIDFDNPESTYKPGNSTNTDPNYDPLNRENYSTLWDCVLYDTTIDNNNTIIKYFNGINTDTFDSYITPTNFTNSSNIYTKTTIIQFQIMNAYTFTTNIASRLVGQSLNDAKTNIITIPKTFNPDSSDTNYDGRSNYYLYTLGSFVTFKQINQNESTGYIDKITLNYEPDNENDTIILDLHDEGMIFNCGQYYNNDLECCSCYIQFKNNNKLSNLGSVKTHENNGIIVPAVYVVLSKADKGKPFMVAQYEYDKNTDYTYNDKLVGDNRPDCVPGLVKSNEAFILTDYTNSFNVGDLVFEYGGEEYYILANYINQTSIEINEPFRVSKEPGGIPHFFNEVDPTQGNETSANLEKVTDVMTYYTDLDKGDILFCHDPTVYGIVIEENTVYYSQEALNDKVICLDVIKECIENPIFKKCTNFYYSYTIIKQDYSDNLITYEDLLKTWIIDTQKSSDIRYVKYYDNISYIEFYIQKDPLSEKKLISPKITDLLININNTCNKYYTINVNEEDISQFYSTSDTGNGNGLATNKLYKDDILLSEAEWYSIENFNVDEIENGVSYKISFNFNINEAFNYNETYTIENLFASMEFWILGKEEDEINPFLIKIPFDIAIKNNDDNIITFKPTLNFGETTCLETTNSTYSSLNFNVKCIDWNTNPTRPSIYTKNNSSIFTYRCEDERPNIFLDMINRRVNETYCCTFSNIENNYINNLCLPKLEEQKRWFIFFYLKSTIPMYTSIQDAAEAFIGLWNDGVSIENVIAQLNDEYMLYSSYIKPSYFNHTDKLSVLEKSNLVYPIFASQIAENLGVIYRKYFVTEPTLKAGENGSIYNKTIMLSDGKEINLNYTKNPNNADTGKNCYSIIRYIIPVDTNKPTISSKGDIYGIFLGNKCPSDNQNYDGNIEGQFNNMETQLTACKDNDNVIIETYNKECYYTSNIVIIKKSDADKIVVTDIADDAYSNTVIHDDFIYTISQIQTKYCEEQQNQLNIYTSCSVNKNPDPPYNDEYDTHCSENENTFNNAKKWLNTITNFYDWMTSTLTQCDGVDGEYDPYNFYLRFFTNKRINNIDNRIVYNVAQSRIIQMQPRFNEDMEEYQGNSTTNINELLNSIGLSIEEEKRSYIPVRNNDGTIKSWVLSDYFEFGTLVYPEEFIILENSECSIRCEPRWNLSAYNMGTGNSDEQNIQNCIQEHCSTSGDIVNLFEWRILLQIKYCKKDGESEPKPVPLPPGYVQIRTWFGDLQDVYGNIFIADQKLVINTNNNSSNNINSFTNNNSVIPFNFPNIGFSDEKYHIKSESESESSESESESGSESLTNCNYYDNQIINPDNSNYISVPQIYNLFREVTGLCGFFPNATREYMYNSIELYFTNMFGIENTNIYNYLKTILNNYKNTFTNEEENNYSNLPINYYSFTTSYDTLKEGLPDLPANLNTYIKNFPDGNTFIQDMNNLSIPSDTSLNISISTNILLDTVLSLTNKIEKVNVSKIYSFYNNILLKTTLNCSFKYIWNDNEEEMIIPDGLYKLSEINKFIQEQFILNKHYLKSSSSSDKLYFIEFGITDIDNKIKLITRKVPTIDELTGPESPYLGYELPENHLNTFSDVSFFPTVTINTVQFSKFIGFNIPFVSDNESADTSVDNEKCFISNIKHSVNTDLLLGEIKSTILIFLLMENYLSHSESSLVVDGSPNTTGSNSFYTTNNIFDLLNKGPIELLIILKATYYKLLLIQGLTQMTFKNLFGADYQTYSELNVDSKTCGIPKDCDIYPNPNFNSNWSSVYDVDMISNNISQSNIINFSCFYNSIQIISETVTTIDKANSNTEYAFINNYTSFTSNLYLVYIIETNNPMDKGLSNNYLSESIISTIETQYDDCECSSEHTQNVCNKFNLLDHLDINGTTGWIDYGINFYKIEIPFKSSITTELDNIHSLKLATTFKINDTCCTTPYDVENDANFKFNTLTNETVNLQITNITTNILDQKETDIVKNNRYYLVVNAQNTYFQINCSVNINEYCFLLKELTDNNYRVYFRVISDADGDYDSNNDGVIDDINLFTNLQNIGDADGWIQALIENPTDGFEINNNNYDNISEFSFLLKTEKIIQKLTDHDTIAGLILEFKVEFTDITDNIYVSGCDIDNYINSSEIITSNSIGNGDNIVYYIYNYTQAIPVGTYFQISSVEGGDILTGNDLDTALENLNNIDDNISYYGQKGCKIEIDTIPAIITEPVTFKAIAASSACQKGDNLYEKYATIGDTINFQFKTSETLLNDDPNIVTGINTDLTYFYIDGHENEVNGKIYNDDDNDTIQIVNNDNIGEDWTLSFVVPTNIPNGILKIVVAYTDGDGNQKVYHWNDLDSYNIQPVAIDTIEPQIITGTTFSSSNCYSLNRAGLNDTLTLILKTNESIRPYSVGTNDCPLSVQFFYKESPQDPLLHELSADVYTYTYTNNNTDTENTITLNLSDDIQGGFNNYLMYYKVTMTDRAGNKKITQEAIATDIYIDTVNPEVSSIDIGIDIDNNGFESVTSHYLYTKDDNNPPVKTYYVKGGGDLYFKIESNETLNTQTNPVNQNCGNSLDYGVDISSILLSSTPDPPDINVTFSNPGMGLEFISSGWSVPQNVNGYINMIVDLIDVTGNQSSTFVYYPDYDGLSTNGFKLDYNIMIDTTEPSISTQSASSDGYNDVNNNIYYAIVGQNIIINFESSEYISTPTVILKGNHNGNFDFNVVGDGDNDDNYIEVYSNNNSTTYYKKWIATYTIPDTWDDKNDGNLDITISEYKDIANNLGTEKEINFTNVIIDTTKPYLKSIKFSGNCKFNNVFYYKKGEKVTLKFESNENIKNVEVTIAGNTEDIYLDYMPGDLRDWTTWYEIPDTWLSTDDGPVNFSINFSDIAGNHGEAVTATTDGSSAIINTQPPTLSDVSIESSNQLNNYAKIGDEITLTFTASEPIQEPVVTIAGSPATVDGTQTSWTATYTIPDTWLSTDDGPVAFTINYNDYAKNDGDEVTTTSNNSIVTIDTTNPVLQAGDGAGAGQIISSNYYDTSNKTWDISEGYFNIAYRNANQIFNFSATDIVGFVNSNIVQLYINSVSSPPENILGPFTTNCDDENEYNISDNTEPFISASATICILTDEWKKLTNGAEYKLDANVRDAVGNEGNASSNNFIVDYNTPKFKNIKTSWDSYGALNADYLLTIGGNVAALYTTMINANNAQAAAQAVFDAAQLAYNQNQTPANQTALDVANTALAAAKAAATAAKTNFDAAASLAGQDKVWIEVTVEFYYVNELNQSKWSDRTITIQIEDEDDDDAGNTWEDVGLENTLPDNANGKVQGTYKVEFSYNELIEYLPNLNTAGGENFSIIAKDLTSPGGNPSDPSQQDETITANNHHPVMEITTTNTFYNDGSKEWIKLSDSDSIPFTFTSDEAVPVADAAAVPGTSPQLLTFTETDIIVTINDTTTLTPINDTYDNNIISNFVTTDNLIFTADVTPTVSDGDKIEVSVVDGAFTDSAGNGNVDDKFIFYYDKEAPIITLPVPIYVNTTANSSYNTISGSITDNLSGVNSNDLVFKVTNPIGDVHTINTNWTYNNDTGKFTVTLPDTFSTESNAYTLSITAKDNVDNEDINSKSFMVDNTPPAITLDSPEYDFSLGGDNKITGSITDNLSGVISASYIIKKGEEEETVVEKTDIDVNSLPPFVIEVNDLLEGDYTLSITAKDNVGNISEKTAAFIIDDFLIKSWSGKCIQDNENADTFSCTVQQNIFAPDNSPFPFFGDNMPGAVLMQIQLSNESPANYSTWQYSIDGGVNWNDPVSGEPAPPIELPYAYDNKGATNIDQVGWIGLLYLPPNPNSNNGNYDLGQIKLRKIYNSLGEYVMVSNEEVVEVDLTRPEIITDGNNDIKIGSDNKELIITFNKKIYSGVETDDSSPGNIILKITEEINKDNFKLKYWPYDAYPTGAAVTPENPNLVGGDDPEIKINDVTKLYNGIDNQFKITLTLKDGYNGPVNYDVNDLAGNMFYIDTIDVYDIYGNPFNITFPPCSNTFNGTCLEPETEIPPQPVLYLNDLTLPQITAITINKDGNTNSNANNNINVKANDTIEISVSSPFDEPLYDPYPVMDSHGECPRVTITHIGDDELQVSEGETVFVKKEGGVLPDANYDRKYIFNYNVPNNKNGLVKFKIDYRDSNWNTGVKTIDYTSTQNTTTDGSRVTVDTSSPAAFDISNFVVDEGIASQNLDPTIFSSKNKTISMSVLIPDDISLDGGILKLEYSIDNQVTWQPWREDDANINIINDSLGNDIDFIMPVSIDESLTNYNWYQDNVMVYFRAIIEDDVGNSTISSNMPSLLINLNPPEIKFNDDPYSCSENSENARIEGTITDNVSYIASVQYNFDSQNWQPYSFSGQPNEVDFNIDIPSTILSQHTTHYITIKAEDEGGNDVQKELSFEVINPNTPPTLTNVIYATPERPGTNFTDYFTVENEGGKQIYLFNFNDDGDENHDDDVPYIQFQITQSGDYYGGGFFISNFKVYLNKYTSKSMSEFESQTQLTPTGYSGGKAVGTANYKATDPEKKSVETCIYLRIFQDNKHIWLLPYLNTLSNGYYALIFTGYEDDVKNVNTVNSTLNDQSTGGMNERWLAKNIILNFKIDNEPPILTEITPITPLSNNVNPEYTFQSNEAGTVSTSISAGFNEHSISVIPDQNLTVKFADLDDGKYSNEKIYVTDDNGNKGSLIISDFTIDTVKPKSIITSNLPVYPENKGFNMTNNELGLYGVSDVYISFSKSVNFNTFGGEIKVKYLPYGDNVDNMVIEYKDLATYGSFSQWNNVDDDKTIWKATFTATGDGRNLNFYLEKEKYHDEAGNNGEEDLVGEPPQSSWYELFSIDRSRNPTLTITNTNNDNNHTIPSENAYFTFTSSKPTTNFSDTDIEIRQFDGNGYAAVEHGASWYLTNPSNDNKTFIGELDVNGAGSFIFRVREGKFTDANSNVNTYSTYPNVDSNVIYTDNNNDKWYEVTIAG